MLHYNHDKRSRGEVQSALGNVTGTEPSLGEQKEPS